MSASSTVDINKTNGSRVKSMVSVATSFTTDKLNIMFAAFVLYGLIVTALQISANTP
jgi:hypothetical protein